MENFCFISLFSDFMIEKCSIHHEHRHFVAFVVVDDPNFPIEQCCCAEREAS